MWSEFQMEEPHFSLKLQVEGLGCGGGGGGQVQEGWTSCGWAAQQPVLPISSAGALHWGELSSSRRVGRNQPTSEHNHLEYPWGKLASLVEERLD